MKPIMCPCGYEKDVIYGIAICSQHCDDIECKQGNGCAYCRRFNALTTYRVVNEYAQEQKRG